MSPESIKAPDSVDARRPLRALEQWPGSCSSGARRFRGRPSSRFASTFTRRAPQGRQPRCGGPSRRIWKTSSLLASRRTLRHDRETLESCGTASKLARPTGAGRSSTRRSGGGRTFPVRSFRWSHRPCARPSRSMWAIARPRTCGSARSARGARYLATSSSSISRFSERSKTSVPNGTIEETKAASQRRAGHSYSRTTR